MKKLLKILTAVALLTLFLGCEITLFPDDILENNITITNDTNYTFYSIQILPTYNWTNKVDMGDPIDITGNGVLNIGESITVNLNDYSSSYLTIVAVDKDNDYWTEDVYYTDDSVTFTWDSINYED